MNKSTVAYRQILQFRQAGQAMLSNQLNFRTKLGYAVKKMLDKTPKLIQPIADLEEKRNEEISDANVDFAEVDDKGVLVYDVVKNQQGQEESRYRYTKESQKAVQAKRNEIIKKYQVLIEAKVDETVEIEPYYATEVMPGLSDIDMDIFKGIVIAPEFQYPESTSDVAAKAVATASVEVGESNNGQAKA